MIFCKHYTYNIFIFRLFLPSINFLVFPTVQVIASHDLKKHVFSLAYLKGIPLKCRNNKKDDSLEPSQEAELQVILNPNGRVVHQMSASSQL